MLLSRLAAWCLLALALFTLPVQAGTHDPGAETFINSVAERGIGFLSNKKLSAAEQRGLFRGLLRDTFDLKTIGRFVLGPAWRNATGTQRSEYQRLFENMVVDVYSARFSNYNDQELKVEGSKPLTDTDTMVNTLIKPKDGGEKIKVDWRVRQTAGAYRVVDVVVEGVSMSVTQRSDFSGILSRGNGDIAVLIDHLKKK